MMLLRSLFILGLTIWSHLIYAQGNLDFTKTQHDFGRVANLDYPPASFSFTNVGDEKVAILMVLMSKDIKVNYPRNFIQPGEKGQIYILPNLNVLGKFNETITVVTNSSETKLNITGEVISIQQCFPNPDNLNIREIRVTDIVTKLPIKDTKIIMTHNQRNTATVSTNKEGLWTGEMPIGQYAFELTKQGYEMLQKEEFISKSVPVIFFEMTPQTTPEVEEIPEEPEPIISNVQNVPEPESELQPENPNQLSRNEFGANNIVLLVDVSLSMRSGNKLELLKESMSNLVGVLRDIDNVSLISYAQSPTILIEGIPGNQKDEIMGQISTLEAKGITNGVKGLHKAYELAQLKRVQGGNNQVILATDGKFTGGTVQPVEVQQFIRQQAEAGYILSIIGYGVDEDAKAFMARMAQSGNGAYIHVTTKDDISQILIEEIKQKSRIR